VRRPALPEVEVADVDLVEILFGDCAHQAERTE
jgi:hypothetical protein